MRSGEVKEVYQVTSKIMFTDFYLARKILFTKFPSIFSMITKDFSKNFPQISFLTRKDSFEIVLLTFLFEYAEENIFSLNFL